MATEEDESCAWWDAVCHGGEAVGKIADTALADFIESIHSAAVHVMDLVGTWWMNVGGPDFESDSVSGLQDNLSYFVWMFGVLGFLIAVAKLAITQDPKSSAVSIGGQLFRMILAGGVYMTAIPLLLEAGDETSIWLLEQAHGDDAETGFSGLLGSSAALMSLSGAAFLVYLLLFLGAIVNFVFMLFRNVMFLVLIVFIVVLAASSGTEAGQQAWRKANGWLLALLLFKPVAAAIYALGFRLLRQNSSTEGYDEIMDGLVSSLTGLLILALASLALPALIKFVVPAAAAGAGAFSGGAALGATAGVAAGAAVIAGTGGAGAGAATASGSGGSAATATGASNAASNGGGPPSSPSNDSGGSPASGSNNGGPSAVDSSDDGGDSPATGSNDGGGSPTTDSDDSGGGASNVIDGRSEDGVDTPQVATSVPPSESNESSDGGAPTADGSSPGGAVDSPPSSDSSGGQPNWAAAAQAHDTAKGAVNSNTDDGEDEA